MHRGIECLTGDCRRDIAVIVVVVVGCFGLGEDLFGSIASACVVAASATVAGTLCFEAEAQEIPTRKEVVGGFG